MPRILLCLCCLLVGCGSKDGGTSQPGKRADVGATKDVSPAAKTASPTPRDPLTGPCPAKRVVVTVAPGLQVERERPSIAPALKIKDPCLWVVRIDPVLYQPVILTAAKHGGKRPIPKWAADHKLVAATNASMFMPNFRSTGMLVSGALVDNGRDNPKFGAFFAFDPRKKGAPLATMFGRDCPGFHVKDLRKRYAGVAQNYRLLDCVGKAIAWKDPKIYSAAAVGMDSKGNVVLLHMRAPYLMATFTQLIAQPANDLVAAMYVEGGPEATVTVNGNNRAFTLVGSYETGFTETSDNKRAWDIPNVLGFKRR